MSFGKEGVKPDLRRILVTEGPDIQCNPILYHSVHCLGNNLRWIDHRVQHLRWMLRHALISHTWPP